MVFSFNLSFLLLQQLYAKEYRKNFGTSEKKAMKKSIKKMLEALLLVRHCWFFFPLFFFLLNLPRPRKATVRFITVIKKASKKQHSYSAHELFLFNSFSSSFFSILLSRKDIEKNRRIVLPSCPSPDPSKMQNSQGSMTL